MKPELTRCYLRFSTTEAYDSPLLRARTFVVEQSVDEYPIDELIGAAHSVSAATQLESVVARVRYFPDTAPHLDTSRYAASVRHADIEHPDLEHTHIEGVCGNPFCDEPDPAMVRAVTRFGVVGLIAGAVGSAFLRGCKCLIRH